MVRRRGAEGRLAVPVGGGGGGGDDADAKRKMAASRAGATCRGQGSGRSGHCRIILTGLGGSATNGIERFSLGWFAPCIRSAAGGGQEMFGIDAIAQRQEEATRSPRTLNSRDDEPTGEASQDLYLLT